MPPITARTFGRVLENLQPHGAVAGDEIVVVERMHERALDAGKARSSSAFHATSNGTGTSVAPSARMRSSLAAGAVSMTTTVHGTPACARRVGDALAGVAGADGPDAALALALVLQHGDGVGGAAQLVGVDRLQVLELEPDVRKPRAVPSFTSGVRSTTPRDALARGLDFVERDRADGRAAVGMAGHCKGG